MVCSLARPAGAVSILRANRSIGVPRLGVPVPTTRVPEAGLFGRPGLRVAKRPHFDAATEVELKYVGTPPFFVAKEDLTAKGAQPALNPPVTGVAERQELAAHLDAPTRVFDADGPGALDGGEPAEARTYPIADVQRRLAEVEEEHRAVALPGGPANLPLDLCNDVAIYAQRIPASEQDSERQGCRKEQSAAIRALTTVRRPPP